MAEEVVLAEMLDRFRRQRYSAANGGRFSLLRFRWVKRDRLAALAGSSLWMIGRTLDVIRISGSALMGRGVEGQTHV